MLSLSLACWGYDRVAAIKDGAVRIEGVDHLAFLDLRVEETFFRQLRFKEFDISEMSLSSYTLSLDSPDRPFVALPIFPSRMFRHQSIYVNTKSGIKSSADLKGKRVGCPEMQMTAPVWQRGIMSEHYGVPFDSVEYFTGAIEPSNELRTEKVPLDLPSSVKVTPIGPGKCLSHMLRDGEIDALYCATRPSTLGCGTVDHLFPNFVEVEKAYFAETQIFPIMHVIAIRRDVHERHPWLARAVCKAFALSLDKSYEALNERAALRYMLPWLQQHVEETKQALGSDRYWRDGLADNRHVIDKFLSYSYEQGLAKRRWTPEELFAPSTTQAFVL